MFTAIRHRKERLRGPEFCEECGQVCRPGCRAETHRNRVRTKVAFEVPYIR